MVGMDPKGELVRCVWNCLLEIESSFPKTVSQAHASVTITYLLWTQKDLSSHNGSLSVFPEILMMPKLPTFFLQEKKKPKHSFKLQTYFCYEQKNVGSIPTEQELNSWISRSLVNIFFADKTLGSSLPKRRLGGFELQNITLEIFWRWDSFPLVCIFGMTPSAFHLFVDNN